MSGHEALLKYCARINRAVSSCNEAKKTNEHNWNNVYLRSTICSRVERLTTVYNCLGISLIRCHYYHVVERWAV